MAEITIKATLFWYEGEGEKVCDHCKRLIDGKWFYPMMQFESADKLKFTDLEPVLCQSCYLTYKENL